MDFLSRATAMSTEGQATEYTPPFPPTDEQQAIIDAACNTTDNLIISALAGAAKTSTLVMVANQPQMREIPTLCLAFNKKISEEMKTRLPPNCECLTLNSLGHRTWSKAIGRRCKVDTRKNYSIIKDLVDATKEQSAKDKLYEVFSDMIRALQYGKSTGWVPESCKRSGGKSLWDSDTAFFESLDEMLPLPAEALVTEAMLISINQSYSGAIDFDDQIFMPTCFPSSFPQFPLTMIDESQDLSALNHAMLDQVVNGNRLIAVGDPCQAIYAFRGAYGDSMERLKHRFNMRELTLSTSFRCPAAVVEAAQWRAPHMRAPDWAKPGSVIEMEDWSVDDLEQDAVIICRNNAPIFSMAIRLLNEGRYPEIVGNDIGKTLLKALAKLGDRSLPQDKAFEELETYRRVRLSKTREHAKASVEDFCDCLAVFISRGETLGGAIAYAERIMTQVGPVKMMTGHKSKGLEFPHVYILDKQLLRMTDKDNRGKNQDKNLYYVMQTRSQDVLYYVTSEGFVGSKPKADQ